MKKNYWTSSRDTPDEMELVSVYGVKGVVLDYLVGRAENQTMCWDRHGRIFTEEGTALDLTLIDEYVMAGMLYSPTTMWQISGPIIQREGIGVVKIHDAPYGERNWGARRYYRHPDRPGWQGFGSTVLAATMQAYVLDTFGIEAKVPKEIILTQCANI